MKGVNFDSYKRIFSDISVISIGNLSGAFFTYGYIFLLSSVLSNYEFGLLATFLYVTSIGYILFDLGLSSAMIRSFSAFKAIPCLKSLLCYFKYHFLLITLIFTCFSFLNTNWIISFLLLLTVISGAAVKFNSSRLQLLELWISCAKVNISPHLLKLLAVGLLTAIIYFYDVNISIGLVFALLALSSMIAAGYSWSQIDKKKVDLSLQGDSLKDSMGYLFFASIFSVVCLRLDVLLINYFISVEAAGHYSRIAIVFFAAPIIIGSINAVILRKLSSNLISKNELKKISIFLLIVGVFVILLGVVLISFIREFQEFFFDDKLEKIFYILSVAYLGSFVFGVWEARIIFLSPPVFMMIKLSQLLICLFLFLATYEHLNILSAAISFLVSRIFGWIVCIIFFKNPKTLLLG